MASGLAFSERTGRHGGVACVSVEPAIPYFYLTVTGLLLISLAVLELASMSPALILVPPRMLNTTRGSATEASSTDSGLDGMR
jgi:hypothetical protein